MPTFTITESEKNDTSASLSYVPSVSSLIDPLPHSPIVLDFSMHVTGEYDLCTEKNE